jgi:hypothetical protein
LKLPYYAHDKKGNCKYDERAHHQMIFADFHLSLLFFVFFSVPIYRQKVNMFTFWEQIRTGKSGSLKRRYKMHIRDRRNVALRV